MDSIVAPRISGHCPRTRPGTDEIWDEAAACFSADQLAALVLAIGAINLWNRIAVTTRMVAGSRRQPAAGPAG
jgi:hypothetical protein